MGDRGRGVKGKAPIPPSMCPVKFNSCLLPIHLFFFDVGGYHDPEGLPGLAHFCEHMLFLGTKKYPVENDYQKVWACSVIIVHVLWTRIAVMSGLRACADGIQFLNDLIRWPS